MGNPIRVGVIGCGGIAQMMHLDFLAAHPELFQVVGLCDVDEDTLNVVAKRYHVSSTFVDYRKLVDMPVDAVLVLSGGLHGKQVVAAATAGKHVFVEKPLATSLPEALEIKEAVDRAGVSLMVGYMKRYDPTYRYAKELVGQLKDLLYVQINVWHPSDSSYRTHHSIYPPATVGSVDPEKMNRRVEALLTEGDLAERVMEALGTSAPMLQRRAYFTMVGSLIHQVYAMRGVLGEPEDVVSTNVWHGGSGVSSTFRFPGDILCAMTWLSVPTYKRYQEQYLFFSSEGRIGLEFPSPYLRNFPTKLTVEGMDGEVSWEKHLVVSYEEAFHEELRHFHQCLVKGSKPETGIDEAIKDVKLMVKMAKMHVG